MLRRFDHFVSSVFRPVARFLLIILLEFRSHWFPVALVSVGSGIIAHSFRPGISWGVGMVVFGGLTLALRKNALVVPGRRDR